MPAAAPRPTAIGTAATKEPVIPAPMVKPAMAATAATPMAIAARMAPSLLALEREHRIKMAHCTIAPSRA